MASKLEWIMALVDRTSSPADRIAGKLGLVEKKLRAVEKAEAAARTDGAKDRLSSSRMSLELQKQDLLTQKVTGETGALVAKWSHALGLVGMVGGAVLGVANAVGSAIASVASLAYRFAQAGVAAAAFKENNLIAFRTLLGTDAAAERLMSTLVGFAAATPFETKDIMEIGKNLLVGGFKEREIPIVLKAVGDVGAMKGFDKQVMDRLVLAMSQIKGKGKLQGGELLQLAEAGVPAGKVYEKLGQTLGVTAQQAQKLISAGKINADTGIFAIVKTIRDDLSGGKLGSMMAQTSQTVTGLWSTIASKPFEWMMDLNTSGGFASLKGALGSVVKLLDSNQGRIKGSIERMFSGVMKLAFGELSGPDGEKRLGEVLDKVLNGFDKVVVGVQVAGSFLKGFFEGLATAAGPAFSGLFSDTKLNETQIKALGDSAREAGLGFAKFLDSVVGLGNGLKTIVSLVEDSFSEKTVTGKLFRGIGYGAGQASKFWHVVGGGAMRDLVGDTASAAWNSVTNPTPSSTLGELQATGASASQTNNITVNLPPGTSASDSAAIKGAVKAGADEGLGMWEGIAMQSGALGG